MSEQAVEASVTDAEAPRENDEQKVDATDWKAKAREWEKRAKENKTAAERLSALEESQKTEQQKLSERAEAAERERDQTRTELLRLRVISESGLPTDLHEFVVGADEDEMRAKATKLKAQFSADARTVDVGLGPRGTAPQNDINAQLRRAAGRT